MIAGIFDPYLDTLGGGERYCLTVAEALLARGWAVDVFWPDDTLKQKAHKKFSLDINRVNFVSYSPRANNLFERFRFERKYDLLFYFSDGSIPFMFGKKNLLHFQVPFHLSHGPFVDWLKFRKIENVICNSFFTKKIIDKTFKVNSIVIYPPVDVKSIIPGQKENIILSSTGG